MPNRNAIHFATTLASLVTCHRRVPTVFLVVPPLRLCRASSPLRKNNPEHKHREGRDEKRPYTLPRRSRDLAATSLHHCFVLTAPQAATAVRSLSLLKTQIILAPNVVSCSVERKAETSKLLA
ncbi:hypothetical protein V8G54_008687 [Vigna mungo]|uniref:Uncharacterized protein n=1 Tax=Vigna mungo TaxID=3915 RepID=A0AAQ3P4C2_VIGMU